MREREKERGREGEGREGREGGDKVIIPQLERRESI